MAAASPYTARMFTGLIEARGRVVAGDARPFGRRLTIDVGAWRGRSGCLIPGDSIAINGVCLTLVEAEPPELHFDVVSETLNRSTLGELSPGDAVNLESSLTASTPIGGHFVQGHVDGVGHVSDIHRDEQGEPARLVVRPSAELMDYLTPKGSVAVQGVSLTVAQLGDETFELALIPTTLELTTLGELRVGDRVNLETDMVNRAVVHWLRRQRGSATGEGFDEGGRAERGEAGKKGAQRVDAPKQAADWQSLRDAGFLD